MKKYIITLKEFLFSSFWFIPITIILGSIFIAQASIYIDREFTLPSILVFEGSADGYRTILSIISSSMMTITGVVFSMTLVALSLASGQFGSRVIRNFMKNTLNQVVLGSYLACFVFCLLILRHVKSEEYLSYVPHFSIFLAMVFALVNIILLIIFIHHISRSIQSEVIIEDVYNELISNIIKLPKISNAVNDTHHHEKIKKLLDKKSFSVEIFFENDGYIEYIDTDGLSCYSDSINAVIWIQKGFGDYITRMSPCIKIYTDTEFLREDIEKVRSFIKLGNRRIPEYDIRYSFWQIIQIALRALSPGINDPFTAISCIDKLGSAISELSHRELPSRYYSQNNTVRLIIAQRTYGEIIALAFDQIEHYAENSPEVLQHLIGVYTSLLSQDLREERRESIDHKRTELLSTAQECFKDKRHIEKIELASHSKKLFS